MFSIVRSKFLAGVAAALALALALPALADKLYLKDGRVLDGTVVRETDTFIQFKVRIGGIETEHTFPKADVTKLEKQTPAPAAAGAQASAAAPSPAPAGSSSAKPKPSAAEKAAKIAKDIDAGTSRVAILNFGAPSSWNGEIEDMVGVQVNAASWRAAVPLLEKDRVDVVVVRINSGGGYTLERSKFQELFENLYKKKFRTVGWVESAISAAAMSPYVLEEFYFMPHGNLGACTSWSGNLQNTEGVQLEMVLMEMEEASRLAGRSPAIMRAMQIQVPLSATIDKETGEVTWFQDTSGDHLVNPADQILTLTASDAVKFKFARGIAATKEELVKAMGLHEVEWAGEEATRLIDENMRATDRAEKRWQLKYREFLQNYAIAEQQQDRNERGKFAGRALSALREMRSMLSSNPNFEWITNTGPAWFAEQEERVKRLLRD